ncbi:DNA-binding response regulator [Candidatus Microgenomates bacterium]|jgi:DNA-binding response OmpR family regulator|nr:MAG: DNA-binding response regulator [Candidatus Microgenomates bacterium]
MVRNILVIEDEKDLNRYIKELLTDNGYSVQAATKGTEALEIIKKTEPDLIILDLGLPDIDGENICRQIKKEHPDLPIIILTAKDGVSNIVHGLDIGADDYMTKPFDGDELLARIKARLRKVPGSAERLKIADLELNPTNHEVKRGNKILRLTPQEFKLLHYLMVNKGRILTRDMILSRLWDSSPDIETRVVDVYIGYLRKKIDVDFDKKLLYSVRGFGYMIKE